MSALAHRHALHGLAFGAMILGGARFVEAKTHRHSPAKHAAQAAPAAPVTAEVKPEVPQPSAPQPTGQAPNQATTPNPQPSPPPGDPLSDTPPPSSYDLARQPGEKSQPEDLSFAAENRSLIGQLLRTLAALLGVLALIYLSAKFILPRMLGQRRSKTASMEVLERLNLDGRNTLVVVGTKAGGRFVLGCGESGVKLLERTPAHGAYVADSDGILRPKPGASSFGDYIGAEPEDDNPKAST